MEIQFQKRGTEYLKTLKEKELWSFYQNLKDKYYNEVKPLLSDDEFDIVDHFVEEHLKRTSIGSNGRNKVKLPHYMASLQKIKGDKKKIKLWTDKFSGECVVSTKLDGVSALWDKQNRKLYTRGNGEYGQDISHLFRYLDLPDSCPDEFLIRGELVMTKKKSECTRNIVTGIISSKIFPKEYLGRLQFIPFEIVSPVFKPKEQLEKLDIIFHNKIEWKVYKELSVENLSHDLETWRKHSIYPIDGVVVRHNKIYPLEKKNPSYAFAFKLLLMDQLAEVVVDNITWNVSKDGYLKPLISFSPVKIGNSKISNVNGQNGNFIVKNSIGVGSRLLISKSGDVIPYIEKVLIPATIVGRPMIPHSWNDSHMEFITEDKDIIEKARCLYFMSGYSIEGLGKQMKELLFESGINSIEKFLHLQKEDLTNIRGMGPKTIDKIFKSYKERQNTISASKIMALSGMLGRGVGENKIEEIIQLWPTWYDDKETPTTVEEIKNKKHVSQFLLSLPKIRIFFSEHVFKKEE
jgi:NAD-dependent DNA ligase